MKKLAVGLVGSGATGKVLGRNALLAGHSLRVFDTQADAMREMEEWSSQQQLTNSLALCDSPADAAKESDIVLTCLPDPESTTKGEHCSFRAIFA